MKTIRLLYPDFVSGGLDTYYFGAHILQHIIPQNAEQPLIKVAIAPPDDQPKTVIDGIYAKDEVLSGIQNAMRAIEAENPDKIITIGGNCMVSQAPFDYLHGKYEDLGIIWIDTHPDVSTAKDGYPNAHAMVLGSLLGYGDSALTDLMKNPKFKASDVLYVGLQEIHDYQKQFLHEVGVDFTIQTEQFISHDDIAHFAKRFKQVVVHLDIDVLDEKLFHSTYFANPELTGDGSGGGKMTMAELKAILAVINQSANVVGLTIAEYLPFDEHALHKTLNVMDIFR